MPELRNNIWKYYTASFLNQFTVFLPFIIYYFQELGLSLGQIAMLQAMVAITVFAFEIPSGYVADRIGRKNSLLIGAVMQLASIVVLFSSKDFFMLAIAHILSGISTAFVSGADSALIYDTLLNLKKEDEYKKIEGRAAVFGEIAIILSAVIGSLIIASGIHLTILLTMISYTLLVFILISMREPSRQKPVRMKKRTQAGVSELLKIVRGAISDPRLRKLFLYSFVVLGISETIFMIYQPYFRATAVPLQYYGYIFALFSIFAAAASLKAHDIEKKIGIYWSLMIMPVFLALTLLGTGMLFIWTGFMFFFLRELVRGYATPVLRDYVNKIAKSDTRATVISTGNMISRIGFIIISSTIAFLSDDFGLKTVLMISGMILILFSLIVAVMFRDKKTSTLQADEA